MSAVIDFVSRRKLALAGAGVADDPCVTVRIRVRDRLAGRCGHDRITFAQACAERRVRNGIPIEEAADISVRAALMHSPFDPDPAA